MTSPDDPTPDASVTDDPVTAAVWSQLADYVSGQATPAEAAAFEERLATDPAFATLAAPALALWKLPLPPVPADQPALDVAAAWQRLEHRLPPLSSSVTGPAPSLPRPRGGPPAPAVGRPAIPPVSGRRPWVTRYPRLTAALAVVALILLGLHVDHRYLRPSFYYRGGATPTVVTLPDHSTATLAPGTYLGTSRSYTHGARTVYLFGAATFQVIPNSSRPFTVQALGVEATALGTTFAVLSDTQPHVTVTVHSGKVAVTLLGPHGTRQPLGVLTAGQVQSLPALTQWFTREGYIVAGAGVSLAEATHIQAALLRAAATLATPQHE